MKILCLLLVQNVFGDYYTGESSYDYVVSDTYVPDSQMPDHSGCYGFLMKDNWSDIEKYFSKLRNINFKEFLNSFTKSDDFTIPDEYLTVVDQVNFLFKRYEGREDYLKNAVKTRTENYWESEYERECNASDYMEDIATSTVEAVRAFGYARTNKLAAKSFFDFGKKLNIAVGMRKHLSNRQIDFMAKWWNYITSDAVMAEIRALYFVPNDFDLDALMTEGRRWIMDLSKSEWDEFERTVKTNVKFMLCRQYQTILETIFNQKNKAVTDFQEVLSKVFSQLSQANPQLAQYHLAEVVSNNTDEEFKKELESSLPNATYGKLFRAIDKSLKRVRRLDRTFLSIRSLIRIVYVTVARVADIDTCNRVLADVEKKVQEYEHNAIKDGSEAHFTNVGFRGSIDDVQFVFTRYATAIFHVCNSDDAEIEQKTGVTRNECLDSMFEIGTQLKSFVKFGKGTAVNLGNMFNDERFEQKLGKSLEEMALHIIGMVDQFVKYAYCGADEMCNDLKLKLRSLL